MHYNPFACVTWVHSLLFYNNTMDRSIFHTKFYSLLTYTTVSNRSKIVSLYKQKWLENIYRTHNRIYHYVIKLSMKLNVS